MCVRKGIEYNFPGLESAESSENSVCVSIGDLNIQEFGSRRLAISNTNQSGDCLQRLAVMEASEPNIYKSSRCREDKVEAVCDYIAMVLSLSAKHG